MADRVGLGRHRAARWLLCAVVLVEQVAGSVDLLLVVSVEQVLGGRSSEQDARGGAVLPCSSVSSWVGRLSGSRCDYLARGGPASGAASWIRMTEKRWVLVSPEVQGILENRM